MTKHCECLAAEPIIRKRSIALGLAITQLMKALATTQILM